MNSVKVSGKVVNSYIYKDTLNITIGCFYQHQDGYADSMFRIWISDQAMKDRYSHISKGDKITVEGHLHLILGMTCGGNRKEKLAIYADKITVDSLKEGSSAGIGGYEQ